MEKFKIIEEFIGYLSNAYGEGFFAKIYATSEDPDNWSLPTRFFSNITTDSGKLVEVTMRPNGTWEER